MGGAQSSEQGQYGFHVLKARDTFNGTEILFLRVIFKLGQGKFTGLPCRN